MKVRQFRFLSKWLALTFQEIVISKVSQRISKRRRDNAIYDID